MPQIQGFETFSRVFQNRGRDYSERDEKTLIPASYKLSEWLKSGVDNIQAVRASGVDFQSAIETSDIMPWLPRVFVDSVEEAAEPLLNITPLFTVQSHEPGTVIEYPARGAVVAGRVNEGQEYPLVQAQEGGASMRASIGKWGVAFKITDEAIKRSRFDIVAWHLRECGRALARLKEGNAAQVLQNLGLVSHDNVSPSDSVFGTTTGRSITGAANGSVLLDDILDAMGLIMDAGFNPDTIVVNPRTYLMFLKDPVLRAIALASGNQIWFGQYSGNPGNRPMGSGMGVSRTKATIPGHAGVGTASGTADFSTQATSAPVMPERWPWPFKIVVSPYIAFNNATNRTNIVIADSSAIGYLLVEEGIQLAEWEDIRVDSRLYRLREKYSFMVAHEGNGITTMKNVKLIPNEIVLPAQATIANASTYTTISRSTAV